MMFSLALLLVLTTGIGYPGENTVEAIDGNPLPSKQDLDGYRHQVNLDGINDIETTKLGRHLFHTKEAGDNDQTISAYKSIPSGESIDEGDDDVKKTHLGRHLYYEDLVQPDLAGDNDQTTSAHNSIPSGGSIDEGKVEKTHLGRHLYYEDLVAPDLAGDNDQTISAYNSTPSSESSNDGNVEKTHLGRHLYYEDLVSPDLGEESEIVYDEAGQESGNGISQTASSA